MNLTLNGKNFDAPNKCSISDLIVALGYENKNIAIEVNEIIIAKSRHNSFNLKEGDKIEIIEAVGGG